MSVTEGFALFDVPTPSEAEVEDIMRQTFGRVADNIDRVIERLRDKGYRFESEAGRYSDPRPPRSPCGPELDKAIAETDERFGDLPAFEYGPGPFPPAFYWFGRIVGNVDLRQRYAYGPSQEETDAKLKADVARTSPEDLPSDTQSEEKRQLIPDLLPSLQSALANFESSLSPEERAAHARQAARQEAARLADRLPHPHADDPVLGRLGNWDPLEVDFKYLAYMLGEEEAELSPKDTGGLALIAEFAASFEHKANVSGAFNPAIHLPAARYDPIVHAEGIRLPFTTYLRRALAQGGFYGTPRPFFQVDMFDMETSGYLPQDQWPPMKQVHSGIFLPDHLVFAELADGLLPF